MTGLVNQAQIAAFVDAVELAQSISHGNRAGEEPEYRWLADPPGMQVVVAYLEQRMPSADRPGDQEPVFFVELPNLTKNQLPLATILSRALGLSMDDQWDDSYFAQRWLGEQLRARKVELVILADTHHLAARAHSIEWLVMFFRQHLSDVPLILVGEGKQMEDLLLWKATAWVVRRFDRISLPGEPDVEQRQ